MEATHFPLFLALKAISELCAASLTPKMAADGWGRCGFKRGSHVQRDVVLVERRDEVRSSEQRSAKRPMAHGKCGLGSGSQGLCYTRALS